MNTNVLSRSDRESVAILTFERPAKLNALNYELVDSIVQALDQIEVEDQIRAVVLTGSGRAFSAASGRAFNAAPMAFTSRSHPAVSSRRRLRPAAVSV